MGSLTVCYVPGTVLATEDITVKIKDSCCHEFVSYKAKVLIPDKDVQILVRHEKILSNEKRILF